MNHRLDLNIGGTCFRQTAGAVIQAPSTPAYGPFVGSADHTPESWVEIDLSPLAPPAVPTGNPAFRADAAWSLYYEDGDYILAQGIVSGQPRWYARLSSGLDSASVYRGFHPGDDSGKTAPASIHYPLDQVLLMHHLSLLGCGFIVHGACLVVDDQALVLAGVSGAGKSTLSRLLAKHAEGLILSDDRIVIRRNATGEWHAWGTPWPGDAGYAAQCHMPLRGIAMLRQSDVNSSTELAPGDALKRLLPMASIPWYSPALVDGALSACESLFSSIPGIDFQFRRDCGAVDCAHELLKRLHPTPTPAA